LFVSLRAAVTVLEGIVVTAGWWCLGFAADAGVDDRFTGVVEGYVVGAGVCLFGMPAGGPGDARVEEVEVPE
jgi:hypothetical protein